MKLGLRYRDPPEGGGPPDVQVFNAATGEPLEHVTSVAFTIQAHDMLPRMSIEFIPGVVHINDDGQQAVTTEVVQGVPTLPTRREDRVVDLDGASQEE